MHDILSTFTEYIINAGNTVILGGSSQHSRNDGRHDHGRPKYEVASPVQLLHGRRLLNKRIVWPYSFAG